MGCPQIGALTARVVNIGCRLNRAESDRIAERLAAAGFVLAEAGDVDLVIINTCAVTGEAEAKTRKAVRRALAGARSPRVIVTGCSASLNAGALTALSDRVIAEPAKGRVAERAIEAAGLIGGGRLAPRRPARPLPVRVGRARVGVKVQDGCNRRCAYCIVWRARGPERSVPVADVIARVRDLAGSGAAEVVLTGVNLGAYAGEDGSEEPAGIARLIDAVLRETRIWRVRLSSIEPMDVCDRLLDSMARAGRRVAPYLHLPLQSGCTETLARMGRPYTAEGFADLAAQIRRRVADVAVSCDVIVGFPGETDAEFEASLALCERVAFSRMHVFRYSARPGTPAAAAPGRVDPRIAAERARIMRELAESMARVDARSRIGTCERAVVECGRSARLGSYHPLIIDGPLGASSASPLVIADVDIMDMDEDGVLHGRVAGTPQEGES